MSRNLSIPNKDKNRVDAIEEVMESYLVKTQLPTVGLRN